MKKRIITICVLMAAAGAVQAKKMDGSGYAQVIQAWQQDRDEVVQQIFYGFLHGAKPKALQNAYTRLVVLETKLANDDVPLYVTGLSDPRDLRSCIRDVVRIYLEHQGIEFNTASFFEGKSYQIMLK